MDLEKLVENGAEEKNRELDRWNAVKKELNVRVNPPSFKQGEIWWSAVGKNVGIEINGKGVDFRRPVLILKKVSNYGFVGIPLTSQLHEQNQWWYASFVFREKTSVLALAQVKTMSALRLLRRIGRMPQDDFLRVKEAFVRFIL